MAKLKSLRTGPTDAEKRKAERMVVEEGARSSGDFKTALVNPDLKLSADEGALAVAYHAFHQKHYVQMHDLICGVVGLQVVKLKKFCDKQLEMIEKFEKSGKPDEVKAVLIAEANDAFIRGTELLRRFGSDVSKNTLMKAALLQRQSEILKMNGRRQKPGFGRCDAPVIDATTNKAVETVPNGVNGVNHDAAHVEETLGAEIGIIDAAVQTEAKKELGV
jgi:hypothetical protein